MKGNCLRLFSFGGKNTGSLGRVTTCIQPCGRCRILHDETKLPDSFENHASSSRDMHTTGRRLPRKNARTPYRVTSSPRGSKGASAPTYLQLRSSLMFSGPSACISLFYYNREPKLATPYLLLLVSRLCHQKGRAMTTPPTRAGRITGNKMASSVVFALR